MKAFQKACEDVMKEERRQREVQDSKFKEVLSKYVKSMPGSITEGNLDSMMA